MLNCIEVPHVSVSGCDFMAAMFDLVSVGIHNQNIRIAPEIQIALAMLFEARLRWSFLLGICSQ